MRDQTAAASWGVIDIFGDLRCDLSGKIRADPCDESGRDVDADPARPPFGEDIGLGGQRPKIGTVQFLEQLAPRDSEPADRPDLVQMMEDLVIGTGGEIISV